MLKPRVHKLHHRFLAGGERHSSHEIEHHVGSRTEPLTRLEIGVAIAGSSGGRGLDAGAGAIRALLAAEGMALSRSTIWRILRHSGSIVPQLQNRSRRSWQRFAAHRPNELPAQNVETAKPHQLRIRPLTMS